MQFLLITCNDDKTEQVIRKKAITGTGTFSKKPKTLYTLNCMFLTLKQTKGRLLFDFNAFQVA